MYISCRKCGVRIQMREVAPGRWRPFDGPDVPHACRPNARLTRRQPGRPYDLAAVDGVPKRASIQPDGGSPQDGPSGRRGLSGVTRPGNEIFASLERQLLQRSWRCGTCGGKVAPALRFDDLILVCSNVRCARLHEISDQTLTATLRRVGIRCQTCGAPASVRRERGKRFVGCSYFPTCDYNVCKVLISCDQECIACLGVCEDVIIAAPAQSDVAHVLDILSCLTQGSGCGAGHVFVDEKSSQSVS